VIRFNVYPLGPCGTDEDVYVCAVTDNPNNNEDKIIEDLVGKDDRRVKDLDLPFILLEEGEVVCKQVDCSSCEGKGKIEDYGSEGLGGPCYDRCEKCEGSGKMFRRVES